MLKRDITYTNFDGEEVTDTFYFNLTQTELVELEVLHQEGLEVTIRRIIRTNDRKGLIEEFKRIILLSYGERSPDGQRFMKSEEISKAFTETMAYDTLFMELATSEDAAVNFIKGIMPAKIRAGMDTGKNLPPPNIQPAENIGKED